MDVNTPNRDWSLVSIGNGASNDVCPASHHKQDENSHIAHGQRFKISSDW